MAVQFAHDADPEKVTKLYYFNKKKVGVMGSLEMYRSSGMTYVQLKE